MGQFDADFADLLPKDSGRDFSADFKDLLPKDTGRDFSDDFADLTPAAKAAAGASQADVRKSEPPELGLDEVSQASRPARMTLTRGGQAQLVASEIAPTGIHSVQDYVIENVGGSLVRGVELAKRMPPVLTLLSAARAIDGYNAIDKGDRAALHAVGNDETKFYFTRSPEDRAALRAESEAKVTASVAELVERSKTLKGMKRDQDVEKALNAETMGEFWDSFKKKPLTFLMNVGLESLPQSLLGVAAAIPGGAVGGIPGAAVAMGVGSGAVDYTASMLEALVKRGVNLTDEASVKKAAADPALLQEAKDIAFRGALAVGAFDATSVGALVRRLGGNFVTRALKQMGMQGTLGAGGEAVKQHLQQEGYQFGQIAAEFGGEVAQAPVEAATVAAVQAAKPTEAQARAQTVAKELAAAVEATDISAGTEQVAVESLSPDRAQLRMVPAAAPQQAQIPAAEVAAAPSAAVQAAPSAPAADAPMPEVEAVEVAPSELSAARDRSDLDAYADRVRGDVVADVELVGSTAAGSVGRDTDLLYTLKSVALPANSEEAAQVVEGLIAKSGIDLDANDTFVRVGDRYFHVSSGAGRQVVENTGYAAEQAGKPRVRLGGPIESFATRSDAVRAAAQQSREFRMRFKAVPHPTEEGAWTVEQVVRTEAQQSADRLTAARAIERLQPDPNRDTITTFIAKMGGLRLSEAPDITRDKYPVRAPNAPMLFLIRRTGGMGVDAMGEYLVEAGYFAERPDEQEIRDAITAELDGQNQYSFAGTEARVEAEKRKQDLQDEAVKWAEEQGIAEIEQVSAPEELASHRDFVPSNESELTGPRLALIELSMRAAELDEAATERAAMQSEGQSDAEYAVALQEIINANVEDVAGRDGRVGAAVEPFSLSGETEAERQARESGERARGERERQEADSRDARDRADAEREDFGLTGSERAADANLNQDSMFSPPELTPAAQAALPDIVERINAIVARLSPTTTVQTPDIIERFGGRPGGGEYDPHLNVIHVALTGLDPKNTARHETIHALRELGLFTPREWTILEKNARRYWLNDYDVLRRWAEFDLPETSQVEEAIAEAFADYGTTGLDAYPNVKKLFDRIVTFLRNVVSMLRGYGFNSRNSFFRALDIFDKIESGEVGRREVGAGPWQSPDGIKYAVPPAAPQNQQAYVVSAQRALRQAMASPPPNTWEADAGLLKRLLVTPRTIAAFDADFVPVYQTAVEQWKFRDQLIAKFERESEPYFKASQEDQSVVNRILEHDRLTGQVGLAGQNMTVHFTSPDAQLSRQGDRITVTDVQKTAYWSVRQMLNSALNEFRDQTLEDFGLPRGTTAAQVTAMAAQATTPADAQRLVKIADILQGIEDSRRTGYVPFSRYGEVGISVRNAMTGTLTHYETVEVGMLQRRGGKQLATIPEVKARLAALRAKYPGQTVSDPFQVPKAGMPPQVKLEEVDALAEMAKIDNQTWDSVRVKLEQAVASQGFRAHFFRSKNIPGYCVAPDTEILTADMRWVRADSLAVGNEVVGFEEASRTPKQHRRMNVAVVEKVTSLKKPCYRLTLSSGRSIVASDNHLILNMRGAILGHTRWNSVADIQVGERIKTFPYGKQREDFDAGWFSGILDGEGWMVRHNQKRSGGMRMGWAQNPGRVLERSLEVARAAGLSAYTPGVATNSKAFNVSFNPWDAALALQLFRPCRFLSEKKWVDAPLPTAKEPDVVIAKEFLGEVDVIGIKTSMHTFVANGICSHNSSDFERGLADYVNGISGYLARRRYAPKWVAAIAPISRNKAKLRQYAQDYQKYVNSPAEEFGFLRSVNFVYYLTSVATWITNLTQVPFVSMPWTTQFTNPAATLAAYTRAEAETTAMLTVKKGVQLYSASNAPADVRAAVQAAYDQGLFIPITTYESMGVARNQGRRLRNLSKVGQLTVEIFGLGFTMAERQNRIATFIALYRLARDRPEVAQNFARVMANNAMGRELASNWSPERFAEFGIDETHFKSGKVNRPTLARNAGTLVFQFKMFMWNMLERMVTMTALQGSEGRAAAALMLIVLGFVSGIWGLPGAENLRDLWELWMRKVKNRDVNADAEMRKLIVELTGSAATAQAVSGGATRALPEPWNIDLSKRVGMGKILPSEPGEALGVSYDLWWKRPMQAMEQLEVDNLLLALAELSPKQAADFLVQLSWAQSGVRSKASDLPVIPKEKVTEGMRVAKAVGFTPGTVANIREAERAEQVAKNAANEARNDLYRRLSKVAADEERAKKSGDQVAAFVAELSEEEVWRDIDKWNKSNPEDHLQIKLDRKTAKKNLAKEFEGADYDKGTRKQARGEVDKLRQVYGR